MQEFTTPPFLQDAQDLLSPAGFRCTGRWYHGTSSGLSERILSQGLRGTGDLETHAKMQQTMGTIGHDSSNHRDPLFITQSKELAYFWANQKAHNRNLYFQQQETPVVFELQLSDELQRQVTTDAGGAALLLEPGNLYLLWLAELYSNCGQHFEKPDPFQMDRMDYLHKLGLAYLNADVPAEQVQLLGR